MILQSQSVLWLLATGKNHEYHAVIPDFLKTCTGEADIAKRRVSDKNMVVIDIAQYDKMLKSGIGNGHYRRVLQLFQVREFRLEAATLVAKGRDKALHIQQRNPPPLNDLVSLTKAQQTVHDLALLQVATQVIIQQRRQGCRPTAVVVGLTNHIAKLQLALGSSTTDSRNGPLDSDDWVILTVPGAAGLVSTASVKPNRPIRLPSRISIIRVTHSRHQQKKALPTQAGKAFGDSAQASRINDPIL